MNILEEVAKQQTQIDTVAGLLEGMLDNPREWQLYIPQLADWLKKYKEKRDG